MRLELSRRKMCSVLILGVPSLLIGCPGRESTQEARVVSLGAVSDFKEGDNILTLNRVLVRRRGNALSALSLVCTHQNCLLRPLVQGTRADGFDCPCHGSRFSSTGEVQVGPAKVRLPYLKLSLFEEKVLLHPEEEVSVEWSLSVS